MNNFQEVKNFINPLKNPINEIEFSKKFANGSIFNPDFVEGERSQSKKTIVFDLDETIRGWDDITDVAFLRHNLKPLLGSLVKLGYRLIIWSASNRPSIQQTLNRYPELEDYFDLIISAENFSFRFLPKDKQEELVKLDEKYYKELLKSAYNEIYPPNGRSFRRIPKNIQLFHYSLIIDDFPMVVDEARQYGFKAFRIFPYKYDNPDSRGLIPQELVDDIEKDFTDNMLGRIVDMIENKPIPDEKIYLVED